MNKTEKRKEIIKQFLTYITEQFPQYEICDDGDLFNIRSLFKLKKEKLLKIIDILN